MRIWVIDASPLIFLAKLDHLDLLRQGADQTIVPPAVFAEISEYPDTATERIAEARQSWLAVRSVEDRRVVDVLKADLDTGESEAIALALEVNADLGSPG